MAATAATTAAIPPEAARASLFCQNIPLLPPLARTFVSETPFLFSVVTVDLTASRLVNHTMSKEYKLKPIGDAGPVVDAGEIFAYARKTGMIASA